MSEEKLKDLPADTSSNPRDLLPAAQEKQDEILSELVQANDMEKIKDLTHLFNAHQAKRNALRINALNDVQDALVRQMADRLKKTPDNFNNTDIANWMKTVQQVMDTSQKTVEQVDTIPAITYQQTNNTQVNVSVVDSLSRESRTRITDAIQKILQNVQNSTDEAVQEAGELVVEPVDVNNNNEVIDNTSNRGDQDSNN